MSRTRVLQPEAIVRIRRDSRYRAALRAPVPPPHWRSAGACLESDPEVFFPTSGDHPTAALEVCQRCSVRDTCLATALRTGEIDGVWGGTTAEERRAMRQVYLIGQRQPVRT